MRLFHSLIDAGPFATRKGYSTRRSAASDAAPSCTVRALRSPAARPRPLPGSRRGRTIRGLLQSCLLACGACSGGPDQADRSWAGTVIELPNGARLVSNPTEGLWRPGEEWRIVEELRIGRVDGDGPDLFAEVSAIGISPHGDIYVIEEQTQELRIFSESGEHLRSVGRRGSGPGEFGHAHSLDWDRRGRLWIADPPNGRYAVLSEGLDSTSYVRRPVTGIIRPWVGGIGADEFLYDVSAGAGPEGETIFLPVRIDSLGGIVDTLPALVSLPAVRVVAMALFRLTPRLTFAFDPRGYTISAHTGTYRLVRRTLDGDTVTIITREHPIAPVTADDHEAIRMELEQLGPLPPEFANPRIPAEKPPLHRIHVGDRGYLFVEVPDPAGGVANLLDVFDPDGRLLGQIRPPFPISSLPALPVFRGGQVVSVTTDSLGVRSVVRGRIHGWE